MCLILFAYRSHPKYPLIVAANRDEFYRRPTRSSHWWPDSPNLFAGKDMEAGGTWMGITRKGRFAAITNVREADRSVPAPRSRGLLPLSFLEQELSVADFSDQLQSTREEYRGYNLLFGNLDRLGYFSNRGELQILEPGIYGLSNAQLDTTWPKVVQGKKLLQQQLVNDELETDALFQVLAPTAIAADEQLPATGISLEWERMLSAICISNPDDSYGTRSSTIVLIDNKQQVCFHERQLPPDIEDEVKVCFGLNQRPDNNQS